MLRDKFIGGIRRWWFILLIAGIILIIGFVLWTPRNISSLASHPDPAQNYEDAVQRIETLLAQEPPDMNPACRLQFLTHNQQVERVIVLVHGYTMCPQQFHELGLSFYDLGYNVLIAPLPRHGLSDRMTDEHSQLKAEELANYADDMVDIANGLGKQVVIAGISGGGVVTAWAAQYRADIDLAVVISPGFGFQQIPTPLTVPAANVFLTLPNSFNWWDASLQLQIKPDYSYPRYSTRALAEILRLGSAVQVAAQREPPAAQSILMVTNANDTSVNNSLTAQVVRDWQEHHATLATYEFGAELQLGHDLIDPTQPNERIDVVYPKLIELITR